MVREICRDEGVLSTKSQPATAADLAVAADLWRRCAITKTAAWAWQPI